MKLLIDSSTNYLYLSLVANKTVKTFYREGKNDHSETLVDFLKRFLDEQNITVDDIKEIYVGRGPGSYTGLRIAGTVSKVMAFIKNKKFYSFSSLDLLLASKMHENGTFIARIDAKKNHSYYKVAKIENGKMEVIKDETFGANEEFASYENAKILEMNDEFFNETPATSILEYHLYQEESTLDYTPNYIRSGI